MSGLRCLKEANADDDGCFVGHIAGIQDVVGFHGKSVGELRTAFEEAVDDYLETCSKLGRKPQKTYSGKLMLRIPPDIHASVATAAETSGESRRPHSDILLTLYIPLSYPGPIVKSQEPY